MVRPEMVTVFPSVIQKTVLTPFIDPFTASRAAPGPVMVRFLLMLMPVAGKMAVEEPATRLKIEGSKTISSPDWASATSPSNDPGPEGLVLVTDRTVKRERSSNTSHTGRYRRT